MKIKPNFWLNVCNYYNNVNRKGKLAVVCECSANVLHTYCWYTSIGSIEIGAMNTEKIYYNEWQKMIISFTYEGMKWSEKKYIFSLRKVSNVKL